MSLNWDSLQTKLDDFWECLPEAAQVVAPWQGSHRFPELTYVREELTGSYKARKYISLLPWIVEQGFQRVRIQGSSHSGNVTQLALLLKERGIEPVYMLEGSD